MYDRYAVFNVFAKVFVDRFEVLEVLDLLEEEYSRIVLS